MARQPEVDPRLNERVKYLPEVISYLDRLGYAIANDAREAAPKKSGRGAESITHEIGYDEHGPYVRISWDQRHFYMMFRELGTSHENAQPFLRPAAEKPRSV